MMFYDVSQCFTRVSQFFMMLNNVSRLVSLATIVITASATVGPPIAAGIGNYPAGIGDNAAKEIPC